MIGKIFITRSGYDPQLGKHVKDPYLGSTPSIGARRYDLRRVLNRGDHLFVISGKVKGFKQFVMGGFEVDKKIPAIQAYYEYPDQRLYELPDGQLAGNVIVNDQGMQHHLDDHNRFDERVKDYIIGKNLLALQEESEIERGREETMFVLQDIFKKKGSTPIEIIGRNSRSMDERQIDELRSWLSSLKQVH